MCRFEWVPIDDMVRNPNFLLAIYSNGGHNDFFYRKYDEKTGLSYHSQYVAPLALKFIEEMSLFYESSGNSLNAEK